MVTHNTEKQQGVWLQKAFTLLVFFPLVWFLNPEKVLLLYIVLGHAHFGLTYWYQFKGGRVKANFVTLFNYMALLAGLFWCAYHHPTALVTFASIFFIVHYYLDEFKMNQERLHFGAFALVIPLVFLLFVGLYVHERTARGFYATSQVGAYLQTWDFYLGHHPMVLDFLAKVPSDMALNLYWPWVFGLAAWAVIYYAVEVYTSKKIAWAQLYILLVTAIAISMLWVGNLRHVTSIFGLIILSHYAHWYLSAYQKLRQFAPQKLPAYFKQVVLANVLVLGLYAYTAYLPHGPLAWEIDRWGFNFHAFMVWTVMHLITTLRADDYKTLFGRLGEKAVLGVQTFTRFR